MAGGGRGVNNALRAFGRPSKLRRRGPRMSPDPDQPSLPDPTPEKSPADPAGDNAESFRQKRRFKRGGGSEAEDEEKPDQAIEVLSSLLQNLVAKKDQRPAAPEPVASPQKPAKYHRLSKTGSGNPAVPTEAGPTSPETAPLASDAPTPATAAVTPAPAVVFRPAPVFDLDAEHRRLRLWKTLAVLSLLALVGLAGYVLWPGRPAGDRTPLTIKPASPTLWTDASLQQLDRALAADQAGDLKGAQSLASAITPPDAAPPPGLAIYLAGLGTRLDRRYDAEADLLRLTKDAAPAGIAAINEGLGFNFMRSRDFEKAADAYKTAVLHDPFSASLLYEEGEVARHLGHLADAEVSFRRALDRVPTGRPELASLRECIGLKLRLCSVEQGQEGEFQTEMDDQLKSPSPSGYWLLTAAAVALQHKDLPAAAGLLSRARRVLGAEQFDALLNDYLFRTQTDRKELAEFFPDPAAHRARLQATTAHTVEP